MRTVRWKRRAARIAEEARLDGIYIIRTSLEAAHLSAAQTVISYKNLCKVERAFRSLKSIIRVRPIFVYDETHVRGHVFLCMLAYYVEWHMRQRLAPLLFEDDDREGAQAKRSSPVSKACPSESAKRKADRKTTADGETVHSLQTLLNHLATYARIEWSFKNYPECRLTNYTDLTPTQIKTFELLQINPEKLFPVK